MFLLLAYFCSEVIILILLLVNILRPFFLIYLFNERFEIVQNTGYNKRCFCYVLGYHLFYKSIITFSLLGINWLHLWERFFTHLLINLFYKEGAFSVSSIFLCNYHYILLVTCDKENVSFRTCDVYYFCVITQY